MNKSTFLAREEEDYHRLRLQKDTPEMWEDGMRTDGGKGSYEWWYFDAHLEDGSKMVIIFYTKAMTEINAALRPYAALNIDYKDGTKLERYLPSATFYASKEQCDVRIGENYFKGDLNHYKIHLEDHDFKLDVIFDSKSKSWRPETGHLYFGDRKNKFAWFVAVPSGFAKVSYNFSGTLVETSGNCYHDHNWGNKSLHKLINHWYWSRSIFGSYTIIACQIIPESKFGTKPVNLIYVQKDGELVLDNSTLLKFYRSYPVSGTLVNKPISNHIIFHYEDGDFTLNLKLDRRRSIIETYLIQNNFKRRLAKMITGFNGAYFRITGEAQLNIYNEKELVETLVNDHAIWELMYFGKPISI